MKNKIKETEKVIKTYTICCPKCDREIVGYKPSQVEWNLKIHLEKCRGKKEWKYILIMDSE